MFVKILFNILKLLFCIFISALISYTATLIGIGAKIESSFDWQILLFECVSLIAVIGIWTIVFVKVKNKIVIIYALLLISWFMLLSLPTVKQQINIDSSIDSGMIYK